MSEDPARELIEAFKADCAPPPSAAESNWAAVQARLEAAPAASGESGTTGDGGTSSATAAASSNGILFGIAGGLVVTAIVAGALMTRPGPEPESATARAAPVSDVDNEPVADPEPEEVSGPAGEAAADSASTLAPPAGAGTDLDGPRPEPAPVEATAVPAGERSTVSRPATKAPVLSAGTLEDEIALIAEAKAALSIGEPGQALAKVKEHGKRFKAGKLVDERELIRMKALCAQGKVDKARSERDAFLQRKPKAAISSRVRDVCPE